MYSKTGSGNYQICDLGKLFINSVPSFPYSVQGKQYASHWLTGGLNQLINIKNTSNYTWPTER